MEQTRSFEYNKIYTEDYIRQTCPNASIESGVYDDKTKYEYLVANAELEYWFIRGGEGWKVDHTWASMTLIPKESAG